MMRFEIRDPKPSAMMGEWRSCRSVLYCISVELLILYDI